MSVFLVSALVGLAATMPLGTTKQAGINVTLNARTDAPFGIKKGLAYNDGSITNILSRPGSATWAYNWGAAQNAPKFQQIPMYWGLGAEGDVNGINAKIAAGDTPYVLGYNEPDMDRGHGGCQATPQQAYDAWGNDMFKFSDRGVKLVCPAISSYNTDVSQFTGYKSGLAWLRSFARDFGTNPLGPTQFRCAAQALHWYGPVTNPVTPAATQAQLFIDYIAYAHTQVDDIFKTTNMDLWITEFAPSPADDVQLMSDFLAIVIPWLDAQSWVARYSPFKAETLVANGALNKAGNTFVNSS
ncbi:hypothetical protein GQ53DRAFT_750069 [Thozetella sp. PMI_491]|nr:hypothetical protein GQ53DRAFT_750069 [Thozetella sp. PMI_491]